MKLTNLHPADQLVAMMNRIYTLGLTTTSGGNLSIRDANGDIWITPSGVDKGSLTRADIMQVRPDGSTVGPHKPSVELPVHSGIYARRPDVNAIVHAHPPAMVAFSLVRKAPEMRLNAGLYRLCGEAGMVDYAIPGSPDLQVWLAQRFGEGYRTVLMDNHGVICGAEDITKAFMMFETATAYAKSELNARKLGKPLCLTEAQLAPQCAPAFGVLEQAAMGNEERAARRDMSAMVRRACAQRLFTSAAGSISLRLSDGSLLITPADTDRRCIEAEDLVRVKDGCCPPGALPDASAALHARIYARHPEINAVILAEPEAAMAFAVSGTELDTHLVPESYVLLRSVGRMPCDASDEALAAALSPAVPTLLVDNRCAILTGKDMLSTFDHLEVLEFTAASVIDALAIGAIQRITDAEVLELNEAYGI